MPYNQVRQGTSEFSTCSVDFTNSTGKIIAYDFGTDCLKWHPLLVKGSMYYVQHAIIKKEKYPAKGYSPLELTVTEHTTLETPFLKRFYT